MGTNKSRQRRVGSAGSAVPTAVTAKHRRAVPASNTAKQRLCALFYIGSSFAYWFLEAKKQKSSE